MTHQKISLNDRFDLEKSPVLLNGTQALVGDSSAVLDNYNLY